MTDIPWREALAGCQSRMRRTFFSLAFVLIIPPVHAQYHTVNLTGGWTIPFDNGPRKYVECGTTGAEWVVSRPAFHEAGHRAPCEMGLRGDIALIPDGVAGDRIGLSGFVTTPFRQTNKLIAPCSLALQLGTGLGFYTRPKEFTHDERNDFIGSCLNCVIDLGPVLTVPVGNDHAVVLGAKFIHNSNGYLRKPNQGLNYLQAELGWRFKSGSKRGVSSDSICMRTRYDARTAPFITIAPGVTVPRHSDAGNDVFYPAYNVQLGWRYAYQHCRSMGLAVDLAYNFADNYAYDIAGEEPPFPMFVGLTAMHETHWGPLSMRLGLGYYVWQSFPDGHVYERAGLFWHFGKDARQAIGLSIKANTCHADFIEWSYSFDLM